MRKNKHEVQKMLNAVFFIIEALGGMTEDAEPQQPEARGLQDGRGTKRRWLTPHAADPKPGEYGFMGPKWSPSNLKGFECAQIGPTCAQVTS